MAKVQKQVEERRKEWRERGRDKEWGVRERRRVGREQTSETRRRTSKKESTIKVGRREGEKEQEGQRRER